ncbi:hypothetical protein BG006_004234, partial [Podila minutissima]
MLGQKDETSRSDRIIEKDDSHVFGSWDEIPSQGAIESARAIEGLDRESYVRFGNEDWVINKLALVVLCEVAQTRNFAESLMELKVWLETAVLARNGEVAMQLLNLIEKEGDLIHRPFISCVEPGDMEEPIKISSLFHFCGDHWLNNSDIERVLQLFGLWYGQNGRYLFVWHFTDRNGRETPPKITKKTEKVFAIVNMKRMYWGCIELDFKTHRIRTADSLDWKVEPKAILDLIEWLIEAKAECNKWIPGRKSVNPLPIQNQQDSNSCGLFALSAIEGAVNKYVDVLKAEPIDLRVRFLAHLCSYGK